VTVLTITQVGNVWLNNGGSPSAVVAATCCAMATSGGDTAWTSGDGRVGLWGIDVATWSALTGLSRSDLLTRSGSAKAAVYVSGGGANFARWPVMYTYPARDTGTGTVTFPQTGSKAWGFVGAVSATLDPSGSATGTSVGGGGSRGLVNAVDHARTFLGYTLPNKYATRDNTISTAKGYRR